MAAGRAAYLLDGDNLRHGLNVDLGFSAEDRAENVRRVGEVARLFADAGMVAVVSLVSPLPRRPQSGTGHAPTRPVCVSWRCSSTPPGDMRSATPRACTARARAGEITGFTGVDDPYEPPGERRSGAAPGHGNRRPWRTG